MTTIHNEDLLTFIHLQSSSVRAAMEKSGSTKRKVNPRKYIQKRLQSTKKAKPMKASSTTTPAKLAYRYSTSDLPSIARRVQPFSRQNYNSMPSWDFLGQTILPPSVEPYYACDPDVDEALQAFGSPKAASEGSPASYRSDPFSPPSSPISESGEDILDPCYDNSGSPAYPAATVPTDTEYYSDVSQFSPLGHYWHW